MEKTPKQILDKIRELIGMYELINQLEKRPEKKESVSETIAALSVIKDFIEGKE